MNNDLYYILLDQGTQWMNKIGRVRAEQDAGEHGYLDGVLTDLAREVTNTPFVANLYHRQMLDKTLRINGEVWGAWSISEAEYNRIMRLIALVPSNREFAKLGSY